MSGNSWIAGALKLGFQGAIYPVHPKAQTILGYKAYASVRDIPDEIDLAIFTIPFAAVIQAVQDCVAKNVKYVHIFTAGFGETGLQEYADIESKVVQIAAQGGARVIGPNCMGVYCPEGGVSWTDEFPAEPGPIGFFSQSGQLAYQVIRKGQHRSMRFSKVISFGNACDLQAQDFVQYLAQDEKTTVIGAYLEGLKDGRAFLDAARNATRKKPVVVWKGGQTEAGSRATVSHTAAIAGSQKIWHGMCGQAGIVQVHSSEEMVCALRAFHAMRLPKGANAAVIGGAGGGSVTMTDCAEKAGLRVPQLTEATMRQLGEFIPIQGTSVKNPLDIVPVWRNPSDMLRVMALLGDDPNIDAIIMSLTPAWVYRALGSRAMNEYLEKAIESEERLGKPVFMVVERLDDAHLDNVRKDATKWLSESGAAVFPEFELAARVMRLMKDYGDYLGRTPAGQSL